VFVFWVKQNPSANPKAETSGRISSSTRWCLKIVRRLTTRRRTSSLAFYLGCWLSYVPSNVAGRLGIFFLQSSPKNAGETFPICRIDNYNAISSRKFQNSPVRFAFFCALGGHYAEICRTRDLLDRQQQSRSLSATFLSVDRAGNKRLSSNRYGAGPANLPRTKARFLKRITPRTPIFA